MNIQKYLFNHKNFVFSIGIIYLLLIILKLANPDPVMFITFTSGILGYTFFPVLMYVWLSVFVHAYEIPIFRYRIKVECEEKTYFLKNMVLCAASFGFLIGIMMLCLSGFWTDLSLLPLCLRNMVCYMVIYVFSVSLFAFIYMRKNDVNLALFITISGLFLYSLSMYTSGTFYDLLFENDFFFKTITLFGATAVILMVTLKENYTFKSKIKLRYLFYGLLLFLQIRTDPDVRFYSYLTNQLFQTYGLDYITIYSYFVWVLPKLIIIVDCLMTFTSYLNDNFIYFQIRNNEKSWFKTILLKVIRISVVYFMIQILVYIMIANIKTVHMEDILILLTNFVWVLFVILILMAVRLMLHTDKSMNYALIVYTGICLFILKMHPAIFWFNLFMAQDFQIALFLFELCFMMVVGYLIIRMLKYNKN